jgi:hypothetical protein
MPPDASSWRIQLNDGLRELATFAASKSGALFPELTECSRERRGVTQGEEVRSKVDSKADHLTPEEVAPHRNSFELPSGDHCRQGRFLRSREEVWSQLESLHLVALTAAAIHISTICGDTDKREVR